MKRLTQGKRMLVWGGLGLLLIVAMAWVGSVVWSSDGLIVGPGSYPCPSGRWNLNVSVTGNGIVNYTVSNAPNTQTVVSAGGFSTYHRWFFFWDEQNRLWTHNSDMGPFAVWSDDGTGTWTQTEVVPSPSAPAVPPEVLRALPRSMQKEFGQKSRTR